MKNGKILILTDGKAGHESQSRAFARALGGEADCVEIHFKSKLHKAFSYLLDRVGVSSLSLFTGLGELPAHVDSAAVVGTGSGTFYAVKALARRLGVKGVVVLYPRGYRPPSRRSSVRIRGTTSSSTRGTISIRSPRS